VLPLRPTLPAPAMCRSAWASALPLPSEP
jgi:hypothetical protein